MANRFGDAFSIHVEQKFGQWGQKKTISRTYQEHTHEKNEKLLNRQIGM